MYKLYGNRHGWKKLIISNYEEEIISKMIATSNECHLYHFLIIERLEDTDIIYKRINDEEEFKEYLLDFKSRQQQSINCFKLRRKR